MSLEDDIQSEDWLTAQLADLIRSCGTRPFLENILLTPEPRHFPIRWRQDRDGVKALADMLLAHAGMHGFSAEVALYSDPLYELDRNDTATGDNGSRHRSGAAAHFLGLDGQVARFACAEHNLPDEATMVGVMGHEVAHAFRNRHGICREDHMLEENLTDLTTVYLGFGVFTTNCSYRYASSGEQRGLAAITRWSHQRLGYLPPVAFCFLLACQVVARGLNVWQRRSIAKHLEPNQRGYYLEVVRDLLDNRAGLLDALGCA